MLISEISQALSERTSAADLAGRSAERLLADPGTLHAELYGDGPLSRKQFCELLGIAESTLTGWLQTERIPQSAAVAYVLFLAVTLLLEKVQSGREGSQVIELADGFAVVKFAVADDGEMVGKVLASSIGDLPTARQVAFAQSGAFDDLVRRQMRLLDDLIATTEEAGNDTPYRMSKLNEERSALDRLKLSNPQEAKRTDKTRSKSSARTTRGAS